MEVGIIGLGHVGSIMNKLFPDAYIYDEPKKIGNKDIINKCDIVFVCVPTPQAVDGKCDVSIVNNVLSWISSDIIVLRSTVPVGFTKDMSKKLNKHIIFQPEYYGETPAHPFENPKNRNWITLGGEREYAQKVAQLYQTVYNSEIIINIVDSDVAELAKYMENSFLATKVAFCNQFYDIANAFGIDYYSLRETWLLDPRIGRSHTVVHQDNRGFGGSCLPKDLSSIICQGKDINVDVSILNAIQNYNNKLHDVVK